MTQLDYITRTIYYNSFMNFLLCKTSDQTLFDGNKQYDNLILNYKS